MGKWWLGDVMAHGGVTACGNMKAHGAGSRKVMTHGGVLARGRSGLIEMGWLMKM